MYFPPPFGKTHCQNFAKDPYTSSCICTVPQFISAVYGKEQAHIPRVVMAHATINFLRYKAYRHIKTVRGPVEVYTMELETFFFQQDGTSAHFAYTYVNI